MSAQVVVHQIHLEAADVDWLWSLIQAQPDSSERKRVLRQIRRGATWYGPLGHAISIDRHGGIGGLKAHLDEEDKRARRALWLERLTTLEGR